MKRLFLFLALIVTFSCYDEPVHQVKNGFSEIEVDDFESQIVTKSVEQKELVTEATASPTLVAGGINDVITITGSGFGTEKGRLRFGLGGYATNNWILSWSDNKIESYIPTNAYSGNIEVRNYANDSIFATTNNVTVKYNVNTGKWKSSEWERAVQVYGQIVWHPKTGTSSELISRFQQALDDWKCASGINWVIGEAWDVNITPPAGTIQTHFAFGYGSSPGAAHEQTFYLECEDGSVYISGSNIVFDSRDDYSAVLHEIGHALGFGHNNNSGSCMVPSGGSKISTYDSEGANNIMDFSTNNPVLCESTIAVADCIRLNTYYFDGDGDGYGGNITEVAESPSPGFVSSSGDCNDNDASINPGATDIPCDGIDQDCNGRDAKYKGCKGDDGGGPGNGNGNGKPKNK